ncbi:MAG: Zn-dependent hydrolase [SAR202 cluster bacterium]|nr:Zn-dependent hydrolase [SAR202 cluster bacterium]
MASALPHLHVRPERIQADLQALEGFTDPSLPYTRRAFSKHYREARQWLAGRFADAGLRVRVDAAGNLIGRLGGDDGPVLMMGSHTDTVEAGGRFDGIVGVLGALEVVRSLQEADVRLGFPLEVVDFICEEATLLGLTPLGSRIMSGNLTAAQIGDERTPFGQSVQQAIGELGGDFHKLREARRNPGDIAGYLELHIEQGPELERAGLDLAVVTAIAAPWRGMATIVGSADHAGATRMPDRRDALAGAAELILAVERIVSSPDLVQESVGTVGWMRISPNMVSVIPGKVEMTVEVRSTQPAALTWANDAINREMGEIAKRRNLDMRLDWQHLEQPVGIPKDMQAAVAQACDDLGQPFMHLPSRASHDAARLAPIAPVGMVFIPCKDGRSHCPEEWAEMRHIALGTRVLGQALLRLNERLAARS